MWNSRRCRPTLSPTLSARTPQYLAIVIVALQPTWTQDQKVGAGVVLGLTNIGYLWHLYLQSYTKRY